ncbi:Peptidase M16 inactive domain protein [Candidatus Arcanobacter lacustris]|uniref:Peptidase M16 inactive domain protein n=1 Tax=Candidatus Arcanibacter lacustris TaxID=1607817 RepID=A0A0F5MN14_9RICK|nr:Peptidase M16 inactive domain protein [Candidatus Arcanobacter lacustris]
MIEVTKLKNGLTIATDQMRDVESVSLNLLVKVGSRYESQEINGISHFLEHMAFKGTPKRSAYKIAEEFDNIGGDFNAYTGREYTVYTAKTLKAHIHVALDIISDIICNSSYDPEEINKELGVILQEIAASNDTPDDIVFDYFQETAFPNQAIGRSILGTEATISKFNQDSFKEYVAKYYRAPNMVLTLAGNINHQEIVAMAGSYFDKLSPLEAETSSGCNYVGGEIITEKDLEQVQFVLGFKSCSYKDDLFITSQLLANLLGGGMSSRLFQEVREKRGLAYSVCSFNSCYNDNGIFSIYAGTSEENVDELYKVVWDQLNKCVDHVGEEELTRAKNQLKASLLMGRDSTSYRSGDLARNIAIHNRVVPAEELVAKINLVDSAAISNLMKQIISCPTPTMALLGKKTNFTRA